PRDRPIVTRIAWVDCSSGVSGDMLLGALEQLGVLADLPAALESVPELQARYSHVSTRRAGLAAVQAHVQAPAEQPTRRLTDVLALLERVAVPAAVSGRARAVFTRLADAEAAAHGIDRDDVHFHEVGAVDAIVDVVGGCLGLHRLGLDRLVVSPVALGGGTAPTGHGPVPVPGPAVLQLLRTSELTGHGGPGDSELATPTGIAILAEHADTTGPMPPLRVERIGVGAGSRDHTDRANVVRIVVGTGGKDEGTSATADGWLLLEANVDDLDPRLWPGILEALLAAGAADAWLTPILMKKGRPAHTLSALTPATAAADVRAVMFRESSTIGIRSATVDKHALDRSWVSVDVHGQPVRVKVARLQGDVVSATPEWDDVAAAARALDQPAKAVLAAAVAAAHDAVS
ncbi:MAG TPA: nickel pincer cofactor biosynthesis protein LarC, partial [Mycobacteriales bacterium]|nr:nickel pincer cofactor biosynthesis protein LarC [Mycobacteriales bacterium]